MWKEREMTEDQAVYELELDYAEVDLDRISRWAKANAHQDVHHLVEQAIKALRLITSEVLSEPLHDTPKGNPVMQSPLALSRTL